MQTSKAILSSKMAALVAGWSLILMAVAAGLAVGFLRPQLFFPEQAEQSLVVLQNKPSLFSLETTLWGFILLLDVVVSWALWQLFKGSQAAGAAVVFSLRMIYSAILAFAIWQLIPMLCGAEGLSADEVLVQRGYFDQIWSMGLIVFGFHLAALAYVARRDKRVPQVWAYLLYLAGFSYSLVHGLMLAGLGASDRVQTLEAVLALPMTIAELSFAIWLIWAAFQGKLHKD